MASVAAIALLTLGALNALLAISVGTCTQGDAGELYGGFITLGFYLAGIGVLLSARPSLRVLAGLLPVVAIGVWHSWFALRLTYGYLALDMSACTTLHATFEAGEAGVWMDGSEPLYILLWLGLRVLLWGGLGLFVRQELAEGSSRSD